LHGFIDLDHYPSHIVEYVLSSQCELVETQRGLWVWRDRVLVEHVARRPRRLLTPDLMRVELGDLQRRLDAAFSSLLVRTAQSVTRKA
jgi:hypothetical protein